MTQPFTWKLSILSLFATVICESYTGIGSRNLKDNKFLTTTKEIIILHGEGGFTNPCLFSLSLTPLWISGDFLPFRCSTIPSFRIWGHFPLFRDSIFYDLGSFSAIPSFQLLGSPEFTAPRYSKGTLRLEIECTSCEMPRLLVIRHLPSNVRLRQFCISRMVFSFCYFNIILSRRIGFSGH